MDSQATEVLHLSNEYMQDGLIYLREIVFGSDHKTFIRLSRRQDDTECPWETQGWREKGTWTTLAQLTKVVEENKKSGWVAEWHPFYAPTAKQFIKEVSFH